MGRIIFSSKPKFKILLIVVLSMALLLVALFISACTPPPIEEEPPQEPQDEFPNTYNSRLFASLNASGPELSFNYPNN